ncbi:MAG: HAD-like domain-containing protein [Benjaminiella poitrasii]|nr:MAG: HAD-like domain-containing protein [Benjaminiella poitrasii]
MAPTALPDTPSYSHIKMIASDLDGTLVVGGFNGGKMTQRTIDSLQALENKGIRIVMASGRPPRSMIPIVNQAGLKHPLIVSCNGGVVLDSVTKEIIKKYSLSTEAVRELIKELKAHFGPDDIMIGGESGTNFRCEEAYAQKRWSWVGHVYTRVDDLDEIANETHTIEKLMVLHREWDGEKLFEYLEKNVLTDPKWKGMINYSFSSPYFVEVSAVGVSKATAIKDISAKFNITRDELIAFGDMPNDCEMLQYAGTGVAMGNAHQRVKDVADLITRDNVDDGVAVVLEEIAKQI